MKIYVLRFVFFCWIITFTVGCNEHYIENKYVISSFKVNQNKISLDTLEVVFDLQFYSDSTHENYFSSSIERGLDGSDIIIRKFGVVDINCDLTLPLKNNIPQSNLKSNIFESVSDFISKFNNKSRNTIGERLIRGIYIIMNSDCTKVHNRSLTYFIIIENKTSLSVDTIYSR